MQKTIVLATLIFIFFSSLKATEPANSLSSNANTSLYCKLLYSEMQLDGLVNYAVFEQAVNGFLKIKNTHHAKDVLTIVDFSKPSTEKRMYVVDLNNRKLLYHSHVSHGKNSGENYATSFSNISGSHKSSLGFYLTGNTYEGRNGYSLILNGLESGINDKARERSIVIHGAEYCDPEKIDESGRLGRSFGCPAIPENLTEPIINAIKDGTVLYIYANDKSYLTNSTILSNGNA